MSKPLDYNRLHGEDQKRFEGKPHGWIQWKGTRPCIDLHCECGAHGHVDHGEFFYHYRCAACGRCYALGAHITLSPLTPEDVVYIEAGNACGFVEDPELRDEGSSEN